MRKNYFVICILLIFLAETAVLAVFMRGGSDFRQDTVAVNEILKSVETNWPHPDGQTAPMLYDYVILDESGNVLWKTAEGLSESVNAAIAHRDTILDVERDGNVVGKVIIRNGAEADYA
ncbi:MAG: hypothetical protein K2H12_05200, partial [Acetatifactor sp.]|nr:hypothetical protein [Acetatifactor sp.]